jgi:hypothetical protein
MSCFEVVGEPRIGGIVPQGGLEPLRGRAPFRRETPDGYPVTGDHDGLAVLDLVEDAGEVPRRLSGSYRNHGYILSELI